jgi:Zn ribbon nucleic-acid-binding protein
MPTLKRMKFVRQMTFKEVYARSQIDELKNKIKIIKHILNDGEIYPDSWRTKWLEEVKAHKWTICAYKKLLTQKRKSAGMQCPFCNTGMVVQFQGNIEGGVPALVACPKCDTKIHRYKTGNKIMESQYKYIELAT